MKKLLLVISFTLISFMAFSQRDGNYNYSLGVRGYNFTQMPKLFNQSNTDTYLTSYFNSYIIKFNDNLWSYRLNGGQLKKEVVFISNGETINGQLKDIAFEMGFEKNFNYSVVQPYFAFDFGYRSNKFDSEAKNNAHTAAYKSVKDGFTVTPTLGLKINPVEQISIFAESNMEWFYSSTTEERSLQAGATTPTSSKYKKGEFLLNPITIGIQFHLDAKN
ncbi:hypothetical protein IWX76_003248 [Pedobacter sp. CAN_A7]|uniref:hypothetical protein n=1 Tax=Pedobacter sp. CAN_A7 TaxID=2787722 RepID=UPI0018CA093E